MRSIPIILTTFLFIGIFARVVVGTQLDDIRGDWDRRRCETLVMAIAHLVPDGKDPSIDTTEFAVNNYAFCMNKVIDDTMKGAISPITQLYGSMLNSSSPVGKSSNYLRANAASLAGALTSYMQGLWARMKILSSKMRIITYTINTMFQRIQSIILSVIFSGLSALKGMMNILRLIWTILIIIIAIIAAVLVVLSILAIFIPGVFGLISMLTTILVTITVIVTVIVISVLGAELGLV
jgi:hypothetical protein